MRASSFLLVACALGLATSACSRDPKKGAVGPDEPAAEPSSQTPKKSRKSEAELDACLEGAKPPEWKRKRVLGKDPKVELEYPEFTSKCATVAQDLTAAFEKHAKESRVDYEKMWREAKAEPAAATLAEWELVDTCTVAHASAKVVSVVCKGSSYTGGAHGSYGTGGYSFVIEGRKVRELKVEDLFDGPGWKKKLSARIATKVNVAKKERGGDPTTGEAVEGMLGTFVLDDGALSFLFGPYSLGSFAEGEFEATFEYPELDDLFAKDGPVSKMPGASKVARPGGPKELGEKEAKAPKETKTPKAPREGLDGVKE